MVRGRVSETDCRGYGLSLQPLAERQQQPRARPPERATKQQPSVDLIRPPSDERDGEVACVQGGRRSPRGPLGQSASSGVASASRMPCSRAATSSNVQI